MVSGLITIRGAVFASAFKAGPIAGVTRAGGVPLEFSDVFFSADFSRPATVSSSARVVAGAAAPALCNVLAKLFAPGAANWKGSADRSTEADNPGSA
jgi:hypothetical protein